MRNAWREIPPTAGLPLTWRDFLPRHGAAKFRSKLAKFLGVPEVQPACSGTAALAIALTTLARRSTRRSVVIPAYTCPLVVAAIVRCGLRPVPCDIRENHFDLCPEALKTLCRDDTLAVVPTHLGGRVADLAAALEYAHAAGAVVIEDAAQALGATSHDRPVGTIGDIGFYSLAAGKGLTLYEGGILVAREPTMREHLRDTARQMLPQRPLWEARRVFELLGYALLYRPTALRLVYGLPMRRALARGKLIEAVGDDIPPDIPLHRLGAWRQAVGANAIERLPAFLAALSAQSISRKQKLAALPGVTVVDDAPDHGGTWPYFMVLMPSTRARDRALSSLWTAGVGVSRLFIHALPDYPDLAAHVGAAPIPRARDFAARMLTVTNSPWLREQEFEYTRAELERCIRSGK
jgi:perosamine synthetase